MHLAQDLFEIVSRLLYQMCMDPFVSGYHNTFVFGLPLHLLFHIAPLVCASVVASAIQQICI